jgi:putative FmdB family regulatory protein
MPVYLFECSDGHRFEKIASIRQFSKTGKCIVCGKRAQLIPSLTAPPILKAGGVGGFYRSTKP